jgi:hypothetical protein
VLVELAEPDDPELEVELELLLEPHAANPSAAATANASAVIRLVDKAISFIRCAARVSVDPAR